MRPQGFAPGGASLEDLGWNDMGFESPPRDSAQGASGDDVVGHPRAHPTGLTPVQSPVHSQQAEIAGRLGGGEESDEEFDEEFDETAELYDPESEAAAEAESEAEEESFEPYTPAVEAAPELPAAPSFAEEPEQVAYEPAAEPPVRAVKPAVAAVTPNPAPRRAPKPRSAPGTKPKSAFTLRLDPSRHLKLRLACAINGRSAQQLVTDALDQLLQNMPEVDAMAQTAKREG
jgi:hypothetical protein